MWRHPGVTPRNAKRNPFCTSSQMLRANMCLYIFWDPAADWAPKTTGVTDNGLVGILAMSAVLYYCSACAFHFILAP